jgi:methionyl-tRNA formyltransferase
MKYLFFGTPEFAAIILEKLIKAGFSPEAVVCNPDRAVGRKKIITAPAAKVIAQKYNIPVLQPENLELGIRNWEFKKIKNIIFDFFVVAAYAKILPKKILEIPKRGAIGVHPSLLPKYRGPTPIQSAILNGETETGVTLFLLDEKVDHGPIVSNVQCQMSNADTYETLLKKLADLSANLLIETAPKFIKGEIKPRPQNEAEATYTKKFSLEDAYADLEKDEPEIIIRKIRALNPEPGVWTIKQIQGKPQRIKIVAAEIENRRLKITKAYAAGEKKATTTR